MAFNSPFIIIGAGGHAGVVLDLLLEQGADVLFLTDTDAGRHNNVVLGVPIAGDDARIDDYTPDMVSLAMGLGISGRGHELMANTHRRLCIARDFAKRGHRFPPLIHSAASIGRNVTLGDGAQVMAGAVVQPNCRIGAHAIINTGATIDHDSSVGDGTHVAPGATLCGRIAIGDASYIGAGATVVNNRTLGNRVFVTAGTVVSANAADDSRLSGSPTKAGPE
ncbi:MAG: acetyltransferase [Rhodospirillales bacterium]